MAKIHIENGIISSSADYSLYHGTSPLATIEAGGLRVQGDITAESCMKEAMQNLCDVCDVVRR